MYKGKEYEKNLARLRKLTPKEQDDLHRIEREAIARFRGSIDELESALGMLRLGHQVGWRVLVLVHSKPTIRKYEEILGITVREYFQEEGPSSERSQGYKIAKTLENFWKAVSGDTKVENRREFG